MFTIVKALPLISCTCRPVIILIQCKGHNKKNKPATQTAGQTLPDATPPVGKIHQISNGIVDPTLTYSTARMLVRQDRHLCLDWKSLFAQFSIMCESCAALFINRPSVARASTFMTCALYLNRFSLVKP